MRSWCIGLAGGTLLGMLCTMALAQTEPKPTEPETLKAKYHAALQEIERLKQELAHEAPAGDFFLAGNAYVKLQKYPEAIAAYTRAIERDPHDALAFRNRGIAALSLRDYQQALTDLNTALELDAQDAVAYNYRGIVHYARRDPQQALADFDQAIALQPQLAQAYNNRGMVWRSLGNYARAGKEFTAAARLGMEIASHHLQGLQEEVRQTQERLHQAGMNPGPADGVMGPQTLAALERFQRAKGLSVTGLLDDATKQVLGLQSPPPSAPSQAAAVPRFVQQPKPEYPLLARQRGWEGTVTLRLKVLPDGTVGAAEVVRSSGHAILDTAALEAARTWTHEPMTHDGAPGPRWVDVSLTFSLDRNATTTEATP
jgi:TonB family protein